MELGGTEFIDPNNGRIHPIWTLLAKTLITVQPIGALLRLKDVATISDTYEEVRTLSRIDGQPSISLSVQKKTEGKHNCISCSNFRELVDNRRMDLPEGAELTVVNDYFRCSQRTIGNS